MPVGTKVAGYFRRRGTVFPAEFNCPQARSAPMETGCAQSPATVHTSFRHLVQYASFLVDAAHALPSAQRILGSTSSLGERFRRDHAFKNPTQIAITSEVLSYFAVAQVPGDEP